MVVQEVDKEKLGKQEPLQPRISWNSNTTDGRTETGTNRNQFYKTYTQYLAASCL